MNSQPELYRAQAQEMRGQAQSARLDNVRDRCLRAASAWDEMAQRAERHRASLAKTEAAKARAVLEAQQVEERALQQADALRAPASPAA